MNPNQKGPGTIIAKDNQISEVEEAQNVLARTLEQSAELIRTLELRLVPAMRDVPPRRKELTEDQQVVDIVRCPIYDRLRNQRIKVETDIIAPLEWILERLAL